LHFFILLAFAAAIGQFTNGVLKRSREIAEAAKMNGKVTFS